MSTPYPRNPDTDSDSDDGAMSTQYPRNPDSDSDSDDDLVDVGTGCDSFVCPVCSSLAQQRTGVGDSDTTTPLMVCTSPACNLVWLQGYGGERPEPRSSACPRCRQTGNWSSQAGGYECRQLFNCAQGNVPY